MSIYKSSSLAMIPTAYKDGKLYSVRPTDGSGDFTFSRGSNLAATRVDVNGLIEKGRENLLLQSNQFDTTWVSSNTTETGGQSGYDGTNNAWLLTKTASFGQINQSISSSGVHTFSVYAKEGTSGWMRMVLIGTANPSAYFNLSNGNVGVTANIISSNSENIGGGWYRYSISINQSSITEVRVYPAEGDNDISGTSGNIYIQDSQLESGLVSTSVIETTTTSVSAGILEDMPRLDYSGSCPSLLLEPQRTNLISQSEYYGGSDWSRTRCGFVTNTSETLSPEGLYNASKMTSTAIQESYAQDNVTLGSTSGTFTFFAKKGDLDYCHALVWDISANGRRQWFNLATGAVGTTTNFGSGYTKVDATIEDYGNGWYRCSFSWSGGNTTSGVRINISSGDGGIGSPINSYGYFYGAQCEASVSYPTSYIPCMGTSQTRSKDSCLATSVSDLIGQGQGTMFFEIDQPYADGVNGAWSISDGSSTNRLTMNTLDVNTTTFTLSIATNYAGGSTNVISTNTTYGLHKVAIQYSETTLKIFVDGAEAASGSTDGFGNYTNFYIGANQAGVGDEIREFKQAVLFPTALTDSECIALTTL